MGKVLNVDLKTPGEIKLEREIYKLREQIAKFKAYDAKRTAYVKELEEQFNHIDELEEEYLAIIKASANAQAFQTEIAKYKEKIKAQRQEINLLNTKLSVSKCPELLNMAKGEIVELDILRSIVKNVQNYTPVELKALLDNAIATKKENEKLRKEVKNLQDSISRLICSLHKNPTNVGQ